ncbi:MAG: FAD-dependent oxidoreductase [Paludibacteraceae bacterium]|nr:FAD-dependent oxidoreductase [Paludibacteraceae bacterium]
MSETNFYNLQLVSKRCEYDKVYTFFFSASQPIPFKAGQWAHVGFSSEGKDKTIEHNLSFASAPADPYVEFSVDLASGSEYKQLLAALTPGDNMKAFKINGEFVVNPSAQSEIVFLSGGIGITPVRSIIRDIQQRQLQVNWSLLHVARTGFLYEEELCKLPNAQWRVNHEGIDDVWDNIIQKPDDTRYYLSGSDRFVEGMKEKLMYSDISSGQIITESFL